jgi:hypothetical protein
MLRRRGRARIRSGRIGRSADKVARQMRRHALSSILGLAIGLPSRDLDAADSCSRHRHIRCCLRRAVKRRCGRTEAGAQPPSEFSLSSVSVLK